MWTEKNNHTDIKNAWTNCTIINLRLWKGHCCITIQYVHASGYNYPIKDEGVKYTYSVNVIAYHPQH